MTKRRAKSKDYDIRAAVVSALLESGVPRRDIRHELTLDTNSDGGRSDVVFLRDGGINTIEIKSGSDKLDRLKAQLDTYGRAFDRVYVVADETHADDVFGGALWWADFWRSEAAQFVGGWRGDLIPRCPDFIRNYQYRRCSEHTSPAAMARLMWRDEAMRVSQRLGGPGGTRCGAIDWMRENACLAGLRPLVINELRARVPNRWEEAFWTRFDAEKAMAAE